MMDAPDGSPVVVEITDWGQGQNRKIWGRVTSVMSDASENDIAMQNILLSNGFDLDFPPEVLEQVKKVREVKKDEAKKIAKQKADYVFKINDRVRIIGSNSIGSIEKIEKKNVDKLELVEASKKNN